MTKALGRAIKLHRVKQGLTGEALAMKADTSQNYLSKIELGQHNPSFNTLAKIAAALNVPLSQIIKEAEEIDAGNE